MTGKDRSGEENTSPPPDLMTFVERWGELQEQSVPDHHKAIIEWLIKALNHDQRNLLLMAFRGAGKSTVVGLFAAWLLLTDPNRRVMVVAADMRLSRKMVRNVQRVIERHPDTQGLKPKERGSWKADEFTINRPRELRDPSMVARSVGANFTGSRADIVICDDVEVPRTCETVFRREELRERLAEIDLVLVPGGRQLYVGTPHSYYSIYADEARMEAGETHPFLDGFDRLVIPVWEEVETEDGGTKMVSAWPDVFSVEHIERLRKRNGPARFTAQMMLKPVSLTSGRLDPDRLRHYDDEIDCHEAQGRTVLTIGGKKMLSASAWWDPAFVRPHQDDSSGDDSVLAVVFGGEDRRFYLHRLVYIAVDARDEATEARQQCQAVVSAVRELNLPNVHVETNGLGTFLPGLLTEELRRQRVRAAVVKEYSRIPKAKRIVEAFEALLADGRLSAHRGVWDTPFVREMREWRPGRDKVHDDALDAVAGALTCEPWRFDTEIPSGLRSGPDWRPGPVIAKTDWDV